MKQLDHQNPELPVRVIDVDDPGTGRNARTLMRRFADLQPESKTAFARASEELSHRAGMKAGGITPSDKRDVGLSLTFASRMDEFLDSTAQTEVKLEVFSAYVSYTVQCCRSEMAATGMYRKATSSAPISIPGFLQALTTVELDEEQEDVFDEDKARRDAINGFEHVWTNWTELAATIDWGIQDWVKDLPLWKTVDAENVTKNSRGIPQYPLVSLLQLDTLRMYELIISSPMCLRQYGRLPYLALAFLGRQPSNAASEGCHSTGQLVMSDKQTKMSSDTLEKIVCLRNSRTAIKVLKEIYVDEAKNVAHDITVRLSKIPLAPGSKPAQSREAKALADDSSMFPLSDPE